MDRHPLPGEPVDQHVDLLLCSHRNPPEFGSSNIRSSVQWGTAICNYGLLLISPDRLK